MRLRLVFVFLTLVGILFPSTSVTAAPSTEVRPETTLPAEPTASQAGGDRPAAEATNELKESLQVAPAQDTLPTPALGSPAVRQKIFDELLLVDVGFFGGKQKIADSEIVTTSLLAFKWAQYPEWERAHEYGLVLYDNAVFGLSYKHKWIWAQRQFFEPSLHLGIVGFYEGRKGLGNLIDYNSYAIQFGFGLEDLLRNYRRLSAQLSFTYGTMGPGGLLAVSFAFPP